MFWLEGVNYGKIDKDAFFCFTCFSEKMRSSFQQQLLFWYYCSFIRNAIVLTRPPRFSALSFFFFYFIFKLVLLGLPWCDHQMVVSMALLHTFSNSHTDQLKKKGFNFQAQTGLSRNNMGFVFGYLRVYMNYGLSSRETFTLGSNYLSTIMFIDL